MGQKVTMEEVQKSNTVEGYREREATGKSSGVLQQDQRNRAEGTVSEEN